MNGHARKRHVLHGIHTHTAVHTCSRHCFILWVQVVCFAGGAHGGSGRRPNGAATATPPLPAEIVAAPPIERLAVVDAAGGTSGSMHGGGGAVRVPVPVAAAAAVGGKPARACGFSEGVCVCGGGLGPPHWPASAWMRCACCGECILYGHRNVALECISWAGLGWAGLGWAGLGWAGLGWAGLGSVTAV